MESSSFAETGLPQTSGQNRPPAPVQDWEKMTNVSGGGSGQRPKLRLVSSVRGSHYRSRYRRRHADGEWLFAAQSPHRENCSSGLIRHVVPGKFHVPGQLESKYQRQRYQSDSTGRGNKAEVRGHHPNVLLEEGWQRLQPVVECGEEGMTLTVRRRRAVQLLLDRANESSLPLFQLPPQCGYAVQTTWRDLSLTAPYDSCHVSMEEDSYVLPLLWRGTPIRVSCPVSLLTSLADGPSSLCCSPFGMSIRVKEMPEHGEPSIIVRGEWTPLVPLAEQCDYALDRRDGEILIVVPYLACGVTIMDGKYTLSLQMDRRVYMLACPVLPPEELLFPHQPPADPALFSENEAKPMLESLLPLIPPFYLAPPFYPHPSYHPNYVPPSPASDIVPPPPPTPVSSATSQEHYSQRFFPREPNEHSSSSSSSSSGEPLFSGHPTMDSSVLSYQMPKPQAPFSNPPKKPPTTASSFSNRIELLNSNPPSHDFSPYYHFYHHPKIPLPGSPQRPQMFSNYHSVTFPPAPLEVQHKPEASEYRAPPRAQSFPHTSSPPSPKPHPSHFLPSYYLPFYPHVTRGEAKQLGLINLDMTPKGNATYFPKRPVYDRGGKTPPKRKPVSDKTNPNTKVNLSDQIRQAPATTPAAHKPVPTPEKLPNPSKGSYRYFYHPYYGYYPVLYPAETLSPAVSTFPKQPEPVPVQQPSHPQHLIYSSSLNSLPPPDYFRYFNQPHVVKPIQEWHGEETNKPLRPLTPSSSNSGQTPKLYTTVDGRNPGVPAPQHNSVQNVHPYFITRHLGPYGGSHNNDKVRGKSDVLIKPPSKTHITTRGVCGFPTDPNCAHPPNCCLDGTGNQFFVFAVPDHLLDPSLASAGGSEHNKSCTLQRLTGDLGVYLIPLNGCGVNKHIHGQTVLHLLELEAKESSKDGRSSETSPVRMTVGCGSSPYVPGEVRFHMTDQAPVQMNPAPVTVLLRIATDESFTRFYPEAHLPLSLMQGKAVYAELSLLDPSEPHTALQVHSCLAYTLTPYLSWMLFYNGCPKAGISQLLPSPDPRLVKRIKITNFFSLLGGSLAHYTLKDPEIYFLCLAEVCSTALGDCNVSCKAGSNSER